MKVEWVKVSDKEIKKIITFEASDLPAPKEETAALKDMIKAKANLIERLNALKEKHLKEEKQVEDAINTYTEAITEAIKLGVSE